jgi:putative FmdB family regulatory protein
MPTYGYRCEACGHEFDHFEKMSSRRKTRRCPVCGEKAERQISGGAGFLFKGEGFYITDYRSEEYRKKEKSESGKQESTKKESGGEAAGEAKPEKPQPTKKKREGGAKKKRS